MTRRSAQTVDYKALLSWTQKQLAYAKQRQANSQARGITNQEALSHDVACAERLVKMLAKCEPGRQVDFYELFKQTV